MEVLVRSRAVSILYALRGFYITLRWKFPGAAWIDPSAHPRQCMIMPLHSFLIFPSCVWPHAAPAAAYFASVLDFTVCYSNSLTLQKDSREETNRETKMKFFLHCELNELQESFAESWSFWKGGVELWNEAKTHVEKGRPLFWWQWYLRLTKFCVET